MKATRSWGSILGMCSAKRGRGFAASSNAGVISAPLGARSRRDVQDFLEGIHSGVSSPLMLLTDGYHFHHISAPSEDILDAVEEKLKDRGYLVPIETWERDDIERHTKR